MSNSFLFVLTILGAKSKKIINMVNKKLIKGIELTCTLLVKTNYPWTINCWYQRVKTSFIFLQGFWEMPLRETGGEKKSLKTVSLRESWHRRYSINANICPYQYVQWLVSQLITASNTSDTKPTIIFLHPLL